MVADQYVERISDELKDKPLDRQLLDRFAAGVRGSGRVCDIGCGPGHVSRYLHERGVDVMGLDFSAEMIAHARRLNPEIEFREGDMRDLDFSDRSLAGIVAAYSLIHIPRPEMGQVLKELRRVLQPGGLLLLSFHIGEETVHLDEWWGLPVCVDFFFFQTKEMTTYLTTAEFEIEKVIEREPYPEVEHQSRRSYIFARKAHR